MGVPVGILNHIERIAHVLTGSVEKVGKARDIYVFSLTDI